MKRAIEPIVIGKRARKRVGDVNELARSIRETGLLHPIVIDDKNQLIAGQRRLKACKSLGWERVPVHVVPLDDILRGEFDENVVREDFLPSEMYAISKNLEERERKAAKERQGGCGRKRSAKLAEQSEQGEARHRVAKAAGVGHATVAKIAEVCEAAEAEPEKYGALVTEMDRTRRVNGVHRKLKIAQQVERIKAEPQQPPDGRYRVIVIDPPWNYHRSGDASHRGAVPYADMAIEEICALPLAEWAHEDCILWLWTTNAFMREAFQCLDAWGFEQKTILTWVKDKMGTGDWLRGKTEHCLLAVRGNPTVVLTNQTTDLPAPTGKHSEKPQKFYKSVEERCPGSKLDVFARQRRDGWESYGFEVV